jgi:hypothetical protein
MIPPSYARPYFWLSEQEQEALFDRHEDLAPSATGLIRGIVVSFSARSSADPHNGNILAKQHPLHMLGSRRYSTRPS